MTFFRRFPLAGLAFALAAAPGLAAPSCRPSKQYTI